MIVKREEAGGLRRRRSAHRSALTFLLNHHTRTSGPSSHTPHSPPWTNNPAPLSIPN